MKILLKYPTRGRPDFFLQRIREWTSFASNASQIAWLVSYDRDDPTMTTGVIAQAESIHPSVICVNGDSKTKIEACNANIAEYEADWSVILLVSDDMWCVRNGWDDLIRQKMTEFFPHTDGALWIFDGAQRKINTLECVGRRRYQSFGYLYHPSYKSFWSDNETTAVGLRDDKLVFIEQSIAHHQHPSWLKGMKHDATYARNHPYWAADKANFYTRQARGFPA